MTYSLYRGTRVGLALQEALAEMEEYEQISPSVRAAVLRKFDEEMCQKLEAVEQRLTVRAERLWSFRFCDSVWQLLLKNVEFLSHNGGTVARVEGKVSTELTIQGTVVTSLNCISSNIVLKYGLIDTWEFYGIKMLLDSVYIFI